MGWKCRNRKTKKHKSRWGGSTPVKEPCAGADNLTEAANIKIEIKPEVIDTLQGYAQHEGNELCGVLMGSQIEDGSFRINKVSPPCVKSNSRCGCVRDAPKANEFIQQDYEASEHTRVYIGEWHTHPEAHPSPSQTDYSAIVNNYHNSSLAVPFLVMIIVGTDGMHVSFYNGNNFIVTT